MRIVDIGITLEITWNHGLKTFQSSSTENLGQLNG